MCVGMRMLTLNVRTVLAVSAVCVAVLTPRCAAGDDSRQAHASMLRVHGELMYRCTEAIEKLLSFERPSAPWLQPVLALNRSANKAPEPDPCCP